MEGSNRRTSQDSESTTRISGELFKVDLNEPDVQSVKSSPPLQRKEERIEGWPRGHAPKKFDGGPNQIISARIQSYEKRKGSAEYYVAYDIFIERSDGQFTVSRRYSDFHQLYKLLHYRYGDRIHTGKGFPPKKLLGNMSEHFLQSRMFQLDELLQHMLRTQAVTQTYEMMLFLDPTKKEFEPFRNDVQFIEPPTWQTINFLDDSNANENMPPDSVTNDSSSTFETSSVKSKQDLSEKTVLVTGATGFLAGHVIKLLMERGYQLRVSLRDLNQREKIMHFTDWVQWDTQIELVQLDLENDDMEQYYKAVHGCSYVFHLAAPTIQSYLYKQKNNINSNDFSFQGSKHPTNEFNYSNSDMYGFNNPNPSQPFDYKRYAHDKIINPTINGTVNILKACLKTVQVKKLVFVGSYGCLFENPPADHVVTEADWNESDNPLKFPYHYAKAVAELEALNLYNQEKTRRENIFDMIFIHPTMVVGPILSTNPLNYSISLVAHFLARNFLTVPNFGYGFVDVRDLASAFLLAAESKVPSGRYLCSSFSLWLSELSTMLQHYFPQYASFGLPVPDALTRAKTYMKNKNKKKRSQHQAQQNSNYTYITLSNTNPTDPQLSKKTTIHSHMDIMFSKDYMDTCLGKCPVFDTRKIREDLDLKITPLATTLVDTVKSLIEFGFVQKRWK